MPLAGESQYLSFQGLRIHYKVVVPETPEKNRMLLLSSPLINTFHWRKLLPELSAEGCLAVLVDLPGFGRSDCAAPQDDDMRANLIWGVLDDVDRATGSPLSLWHLTGHGCACGTILRMASLYPDSVKTQIHISPTFSMDIARHQADAVRWYNANVLDAQRFHRMIEHYSGYPLDDYIVDRMRRPLTRPGERTAFSRMLTHAVRPPRQGLGFCPAMALVGGLDPLLDSVRLEQIHNLLPGAELHRLANAGHFPMETHSKALRDYLRGWLRYTN